MRPTVSVLMAARNPYGDTYPAGLFKQAVDSTLSMQNLDLELIIVDDASEEPIEPPNDDPRITMLRHEERTGPALAYQTAAEYSDGQYAIVQSVRSWYAPGSFKRMADILDTRPDIGFVYGITNYRGNRKTRYVPPPFSVRGFLRNFDSLFGYMYRAEALDHGAAYTNYLNTIDGPVDIADYDFVMQLIITHGYKGLPIPHDVLYYYYTGGSSQQTSLVHKYQREIDQVFAERWKQ